VNHAGALVLIIGTVLVASVLIAVAALVLRRRVFAGEPSDEWRRVVKRLAWSDKVKVMGATMRQQRVERPELEQAQLVYVRYCEDVSERSPVRAHPKARIFFGVLFAVVALGEAAFAVGGHGPQRALSGVEAVVFATQAVLWTSVFPHSLERRRGQLARLRRQLEGDYAG
jgi:hypothetical protein